MSLSTARDPRRARVGAPAATGALLLAAALALAACGGAPSASTLTPVATPAPTPAEVTPAPATPSMPPPTEVPGGGDRTAPPAPGVIATAWGDAWDALPPGFPLFPGSTPADPEDPTGGPVSGAYVTEVPAEDAAALQQVGLEGAGYSTEALTGPYEDGSLVIDAVGQNPACRVQVTVRPFGGLTLISILLAAECPWG